MIESKDVVEAIRNRMYRRHMTQQDLSNESGVAQGYICNLLSGKQSVEGLSLKKFNQLFPRAVCYLEGTPAAIHVGENSGNVIGVNNGMLSFECFSAVIDKIMDSDLTDAEKLKFIQVIKD